MSLQVSETYSWKWLNFPFDPRFQKQWFLKNYGWTAEGLRGFVAGRTVLDAGCGVGWFAEWMADLGAGTVCAVDFCDSVTKVPRREAVHVVRADIGHLPFRMRFDYVNCDGVIHHTPNPRRVFTELLRHLREGGTMTLYVYKRKGWLREGVDDLIRGATVHSHPLCLAASAFLTGVGFLLTKISLRFQRFVYWNVVKCFWNREMGGWTFSLMVNYDWYRPRYAHRYAPQEINEWFSGLRVTRFDVSESGISVKAKLQASYNPHRAISSNTHLGIGCSSFFNALAVSKKNDMISSLFINHLEKPPLLTHQDKSFIAFAAPWS